MRALTDRSGELADGLAQIRRQFQLPQGFPAEVEAAATTAAGRAPSEHVDRTDDPYVTLDPQHSRDLDQAFHITRSGADVLLHYAIADVAWFVADGDPLDVEAWRRGATQYLPDGNVRLYPAALSEDAASLLPDGPRPAVVFHVRVAEDGAATLDGVQRSIIRSRAKLAYDTVREDQLPDGFVDLSRRIAAAEAGRGAARIDPADQQVVRTAEGKFELSFTPRLASEEQNAAMSLATNLAVAQAMVGAGTGLFRVMADPDRRSVARLRHTAKAFRLDWPESESLVDFERRLRPDRPAEQAMMLAIRRSGGRASYTAYEPGVTPWHAAVAATYAHATAPLRRLADRYVVRAALAIANGRPLDQGVSEAFAKLPEVMADADQLSAQIDRAVIDLAEAVMLADHVGEECHAVVTDVDDRGTSVQLVEYPVLARMTARGVVPGEEIAVRLESVDPEQRTVTLRRLS